MDGGGVGVVKTLVSRPGIRVSRHNAGALIDRARDQPAPKATRLFFNVRELKKLINDVMRPHGRPGRKRGAARGRTLVSGERASQNRAYLLTERPLLVLCVFQMTAARLENIVRRSSVVATLFFFPFLRENCDRYINAVDFNWSFISPVTALSALSQNRSRKFH